jgi:CRISPR/Cas system-associated protein Csx1
VNIEGLGTKHVRVYEFSSIEVEDEEIEMTVYIDTNLNWHLKIEFAMKILTQEIDFQINLKDTNIAAIS